MRIQQYNHETDDWTTLLPVSQTVSVSAIDDGMLRGIEVHGLDKSNQLQCFRLIFTRDEIGKII